MLALRLIGAGIVNIDLELLLVLFLLDGLILIWLDLLILLSVLGYIRLVGHFHHFQRILELIQILQTELVVGLSSVHRLLRLEILVHLLLLVLRPGLLALGLLALAFV